MCEHLHKFHSNSIFNKAKCIDSLIAINSLSLAAFPAVYGNAMNKGVLKEKVTEALQGIQNKLLEEEKRHITIAAVSFTSS